MIVALRIIAIVAAFAVAVGAGFLMGHDVGWKQGKQWGILIGVGACIDAQQPAPRAGPAL